MIRRSFIADGIGLRTLLLAVVIFVGGSSKCFSCLRSKATGRNFGALRSSRVSSKAWTSRAGPRDCLSFSRSSLRFLSSASSLRRAFLVQRHDILFDLLANTTHVFDRVTKLRIATRAAARARPKLVEEERSCRHRINDLDRSDFVVGQPVLQRTFANFRIVGQRWQDNVGFHALQLSGAPPARGKIFESSI